MCVCVLRESVQSTQLDYDDDDDGIMDTHSQNAIATKSWSKQV